MGGKKVPYEKTKVAEKHVVKWNMVSYFAMPEQTRHKRLDNAEKTSVLTGRRRPARGLQHKLASLNAKSKLKVNQTKQLHAAVDFTNHLKVDPFREHRPAEQDDQAS